VAKKAVADIALALMVCPQWLRSSSMVRYIVDILQNTISPVSKAIARRSGRKFTTRASAAKARARSADSLGGREHQRADESTTHLHVGRSANATVCSGDDAPRILNRISAARSETRAIPAFVRQWR
jgi:hypothetical protein